MKKLAVLLVLSLGSAFGSAISGTTQWEVRTTGSDANGGGFDTSSTGTDRSQQDAAFQSYTDLVIGGTTTQGTSAAHPFGATDVGNIVNVISGAGCTVQRRQILSVSGVTATFDASLGTATSTCTANLGGALLTPDAALGALGTASTEAGNTIHVKAGTYTRTTSLTATSKVAFTMVGYQTTHLDGGTKPLFTTATNSTPLVLTGGGYPFIFENISFSNTAATRSYGFKSNVGGAYNYTILHNCILDGFSWGVIADNSLSSAGYIMLVNSEIKNSTLGGAYAWFGLVSWGSYIHDNTGYGLRKASAQNDGVFDVIDSIISSNTTGIAADTSAIYLRVLNSDVVSNTGDGILISNVQCTATFQNDIIYGNGGYGVDVAGTAQNYQNLMSGRNAYGSNTSGDTHFFLKTANDITLTANPFTSSGTGDFTLNSTSGGGALLKGLALPTTFPGGSVNFRDVGAVQTSGGPTSGGGTRAYATAQ